jgi:hypothetical protein
VAHSCTSHIPVAVLPPCSQTSVFSQAGKKLSLTFLMFALYLFVLMFFALETGNFCSMDNRDCSVNIVGTVFSLSPIRVKKSGQLDLI